MNIRKFTESDRPFLQQLYLDSRRHAWSWLEGTHWQMQDFDNLTEGETIWVAEHEGQRLGFASLWLEDNFLHHLFVSPQVQGQGVGSALLQHVQRQFTAKGALKCLLKNHAALTFYQRHGWQLVGYGESSEGQYGLMHYPLP